MTTKIYVLVTHTNDDRIIDLGYAKDLKMVQEAVGSDEVKEQLEVNWYQKPVLSVN